MISVQPIGVQVNYRGKMVPKTTAPRSIEHNYSKAGSIIGNIGWSILFLGLVMGAAKGISNFANKLSDKKPAKSEINEQPNNIDGSRFFHKIEY